MSPNLYDLLDVEESASREEIRAAWKSATADLDPTDRRFRAYNDAASVLLDDDARAAYDAQLAETREHEAAEVDPSPAPVVDQPAPVVEDPAPVEDLAPVAQDAPPVAQDPPVVEDAPPGAHDAPPAADTAAPVTTTAPPADAPDDAADAGPSWRTVVPVVVLAVLSVALLVTVFALPGGHADPSPREQQEQAEAAEEAGQSAVDAAAAMVPDVLGYDYRTFDEDEQRASQYLTDGFAADRSKLLEGLKKDVVKDKVVVNAAASATALTRVSDDGAKAKVVVFIEQESRKGNGTPQPLHMWATFTLVRGDDGDWLLDDICTEDRC